MKTTVLAIIAALSATPVLPNEAHHAPAAATPIASDTVKAEVRKVDKAAGKITLKHGELRNLGMPAMTMVFAVREAAALEAVREGDAVTATIENAKGAYAVTRLEPSK